MRRILRRTVDSGSTGVFRCGINLRLRKHVRALAVTVVVSLLVASLSPAGTTRNVNGRTSAGVQDGNSLPAQLYRSVTTTVASLGGWIASFVATKSSHSVAYQPVAAYISPAPPFIDAPTSLSVTAASSSNISLSWTAPAGTIDHYVVERSESIQGPFFFVANVTGATTKNDTTVTNLHAYLYRVRAVSNTGAVSPPSNMALGTAISFQFSSLAGQEVRAQHFYDVRTAINLVRPMANLAAASWARSNLVGLEVKADDVNEMRTALDAALTALSIPVTAYTDPTLSVGANGTLIKAIHIEQLQTRSTRGSSTSSGPLDSDSSTARLDPLNQTGGGGENPLSRNFNWKLPLVKLTGRAGLDLGLMLSYNSLVWTKTGTNTMTFDDDHGFPGPGFRLGFPVIQQLYFNTEVGTQAFLLINPDGSRVELRQVGTSALYEAADSSHLLLDSSDMTLRTTDGTQHSYSSIGGEFKCTQIKDRNGNYITINYVNGRLDTVVDTLARNIKFNYDANGRPTSITQTWNQGLPSQVTHYWARFEYANVPIDFNFGTMTVNGLVDNSTLTTLSRVRLPNDSYIDFTYTSWGQVSKVTSFAADNSPLHYRSYNLPQTGGTAHDDCPRFTSRKEWAKYWNGDTDGTMATNEEAETAFIVPVSDTWTMPDTTQQTGMRAQVTAPDLTMNKIYFIGTAGTSSGWRRALAALVNSYDSSGVLRRQSMATWTQDNTTASYPQNPRVIETNVYDPEGNRARVQTTYQSFTFTNGTSCQLPRDIYEYAANASTILRSTRTDYNTSTVYTDRRILGLVSEQKLYEGDANNGGVLKSQVGFFYDNDNGSSSINGTDAPVQHDNINYTATFVTGRANLSSVRRYNIDNLAQFTTTRIKYNTAGAIVSSKDASNHETLISYADSFSDNNNSRNTLAYPTTFTDADGFSSTAKYHFDFGEITYTRTPQPNVTTNTPGPEQTFTFDTIGRLQQSTNLVNNAYTRYEYPTSQIRVDTYTTMQEGLGESHSFMITDGIGRVLATATDLPGSIGGFSGERVVYDVMGRVIKTSNPTETNASGAPSQWTTAGDDAAAGWLYTEQTYDWKGRPLRTTHPDLTYKEASYSGCGCAGGEVVTLTDEGTVVSGVTKKRQEKHYSDVLGRPWKKETMNWDGTGPNGTAPNNTVYATTVTTYNVRDEVTQVRQYAGAEGSATFQDTTTSYDGYGRLSTKHVPGQNAGTSTVYTYNADDTLASKTDARGASATYGYNNRHLVTTVAHAAPAGISLAANVTFAYDAAGNRTSMTDGLGSKSYNYTQLSQLQSETRVLSGVGTFAFTYDYTLSGQLKKITDASNTTINYGYDVAGRLTGVTGSDTLVANVSTYASGFQYRAWGALKQASVSTLNSTFSYNSRLKATNFNISGGVNVNENYDYYSDGRLSFVHNTVDINFDRALRYDHVGRLTFAGAGGEARNDFGPIPFLETFEYDAFNHVIERYTETWGNGYFDAGSYTNDRRSGWGYDADGRVTTIDTRTYTYDSAGQNITLTGQRWTPNGFVPTSTESGFDGDGNRVRDNSGSSGSMILTYYLRSTVLDNVIVEELNSTRQKQLGYVYTPSLNSVAIQFVGQNFVQFKQMSPTSTSEHGVFTTGSSTSRTEFDPMGASVRKNGNGPFGHHGDEGEVPDGGGGSMDSRLGALSNPGAGCTLDGVWVPCDWISRFANSIEVQYNGVYRNGRDGRRPVREPLRDYGVGLYGMLVPNSNGDGWHYELVTIQQWDGRFKPGERWLKREEIGSLMDKMLKFLDEHPECEKYTNDLLKKLGESTGFYAGTIREIIDQFRRTGEILTDGTVMTTGGGVTGSGLGFPVISLIYGTTDDNTTVSLMHEMLHWAGMVKNLSTNKYSDYYNDDALATGWNQLGVVMTVDEYRRTYPKHSEAMKKLTGTPSDFASSTLSGNAQFVACMNQWNSGYTPKHVDKPKP